MENEPVIGEEIPEEGRVSGQIFPRQRGGFLGKVPKEILFSPGGMTLVFLAVVMEVLDIIPIPFLDQILELPLEIIFIVFFKFITKLPLSACLIPFLIERIPLINDIFPTWLIRLFL
jgi:hypothetical protein